MADARLPSPGRLALREAATQISLFWRNPVQALFLAGLPLLLVPLLHALNPHTLVVLPGSEAATINNADGSVGVDLFQPAPYDQYAVPVLAAFGIASACFATLAIRLTVARDTGALKRIRSTPLPAGAHLAGRVAAAVTVGVAVAAATIAEGAAFYDVDVFADRLPAVFVTAVIGAGAFCALGMALTRLLPSAEAAPGIVLAVLFPVAFLSNVFFPPELAPDWMRQVGSWLPLGPLARAMAVAFNPQAPGNGFSPADLARVAAWGVAGGVLAATTFRWSPAHERSAPANRTGRTRRNPTVALAVLGTAALVASIGWQAATDSDAPNLTRSLGPIESFPDGVSIATTEVPTDAPERQDPANPLAVLVPPGETSLGLAVVREGDNIGVLTLRSPIAGCDAVPVDALDAGWVASIGGAGSPAPPAVLADPCSGWAYAADGTCISTGCPVGLFVVPTRLDGGVLLVDLGAIGPEPALSVGDPAPPAPALQVANYTASGTIDGQPAPGAVSLVWDDSALHMAAATAPRGTPDILAITTPTQAGGAFTGVVVAGEPLLELSPQEPLRWLSLALGDEDSGENAAGTGKVVIRRSGPNAWTITGSGIELNLGATSAVPPWCAVTVELAGRDSPGSIDVSLDSGSACPTA